MLGIMIRVSLFSHCSWSHWLQFEQHPSLLHLHVIKVRLRTLNCHLPAAWGLTGSVLTPSHVALWVVDWGAPLEADRLCMWRPSVSSAAAVVFRTSTSTWLSFLFAFSKMFLKVSIKFVWTMTSVKKSYSCSDIWNKLANRRIDRRTNMVLL